MFLLFSQKGCLQAFLPNGLEYRICTGAKSSCGKPSRSRHSSSLALHENLEKKKKLPVHQPPNHLLGLPAAAQPERSSKPTSTTHPSQSLNYPAIDVIQKFLETFSMTNAKTFTKVSVMTISGLQHCLRSMSLIHSFVFFVELLMDLFGGAFEC